MDLKRLEKLHDSNVTAHVMLARQRYDNLYKTHKSLEDLIEGAEYILRDLSEHLAITADDSETVMEARTLVFNTVHESLMYAIKTNFESDDSRLFEQCCQFNDQTVSCLKQFGAPLLLRSLQLDAAVVELSDLDNRTNPEQKIDCLLTAYDLIFAEIKGAIAEIISTLPNVVENVVIPTIDNWEIPQLLIAVIVRSKPLHWASNLYYIKAFGGEQKDFLRNIFGHYEEAVKRLNTLSLSVESKEAKKEKGINFVEFIQTAENLREIKDDWSTVKEWKAKMMVNLIIRSTNSGDNE